ncbi:MAG TPA: GNAT family N-acetyltransferase [Pyrinomonadaceae bacterium]|nr:GNAT family N-acetyltransferase [Pyrinomonadaceae bacterium]
MIAQNKDFNYRLSILRQPAEWDDSRLRTRWAGLVEKSENINAIYSSAVWFDLLRSKYSPTELGIVVAYDRDGEVVGLAPVLFKDHPFQYYVGRYPIITRQLKAAHVLGSVPMLPSDPAISSQLLDLLFEARVDCAYMDTVPADNSFVKRALDTWRTSHFVYAPGGSRPWHMLQIPASSAEYLSRMSSKTRSTLKKKAKKLAEAAGGELELTRIDLANQVGPFLSEAVKVSRKSWQHEILGTRINDSDDDRVWGERLAAAGLMRSYLLKAGDRACAFVVGHQFNGVFHYVELGYDRELSEYSPGTVLLHLLIQDLCDHQPPATLNFGMGDADYKRRFGNVQTEDVSIVVLRKTLPNYVLIRSHALLRYLARTARRIVTKIRKGAEGSGHVSTPLPALGANARAR